MKLNNNTYFISDPHYGHKNLVRGESNWEHKRQCRDFDTREEMNETLVSRINEKVPETGTLICLGDWSFGGKGNIWHLRRDINCNDVHLILGNHDHHIERNKSLNIPTGDIDRYREITGILPDSQMIETKYVPIKVRDFFSSVSHYKEAQYKVDGYRYHFVLSHYAMRVWNKHHHGSIMLYGHSHGTLDEFTPNTANPNWIGDRYYTRNYRTMDVGLDTNDLYPYHIDEIVDMMRDREVGIEIDHHN